MKGVNLNELRNAMASQNMTNAECQHQPDSPKRFLGVYGVGWLSIWIVYAVILLAATHYPEVNLPDVPNSDKWIHAYAYFVLMSLWGAWSMTWKSPIQGILAGVVFLMLFGGIDELTQPIFNRHADTWDWCCDVLGIVMSGGMFWLVSKFVVRSGDNSNCNI